MARRCGSPSSARERPAQEKGRDEREGGTDGEVLHAPLDQEREEAQADPEDSILIPGGAQAQQSRADDRRQDQRCGRDPRLRRKGEAGAVRPLEIAAVAHRADVRREIEQRRHVREHARSESQERPLGDHPGRGLPDRQTRVAVGINGAREAGAQHQGRAQGARQEETHGEFPGVRWQSATSKHSEHDYGDEERGERSPRFQEEDRHDVQRPQGAPRRPDPRRSGAADSDQDQKESQVQEGRQVVRVHERRTGCRDPPAGVAREGQKSLESRRRDDGPDQPLESAIVRDRVRRRREQQEGNDDVPEPQGRRQRVGGAQGREEGESEPPHGQDRKPSKRVGEQRRAEVQWPGRCPGEARAREGESVQDEERQGRASPFTERGEHDDRRGGDERDETPHGSLLPSGTACGRA